MNDSPRDGNSCKFRAPRLRIGNQTARSAFDLMAPFEYAIQNRFGAFEWFPDRDRGGAGWEEKDVAPAVRAKIRRTATDHDIRLSVHAPWRLDLAQPEALPRLAESLEFALDVDASILNVHLCQREGMDAFLEGLVRFLDLLRGSSLGLSLENTPETGPEAFNELFALLAREQHAARERVGMCLDLGHANLAQGFRNDFLGFMDTLALHVPIIHVHAHENFGDRDTHLPVFTGPSASDPRGMCGFVHRMKGRDFTGSIILEQWPEPPSLLDQARERLLALFASPADHGEDTA